jgi:hypothetical protein
MAPKLLRACGMIRRFRRTVVAELHVSGMQGADRSSQTPAAHRFHFGCDESSTDAIRVSYTVGARRVASYSNLEELTCV